MVSRQLLLLVCWLQLLLALVHGESLDNESDRRQLGGRDKPPPGMAVIRSTKSLQETRNDLMAALNANPNLRVVADINHAEAALTANLSLDHPVELVVFGNPALGTPLLQAEPRVGLDLPQKMLLWEEPDGRVYVGYNKADYLGTRYPDIADLPQLDTIKGALATADCCCVFSLYIQEGGGGIDVSSSCVHLPFYLSVEEKKEKEGGEWPRRLKVSSLPDKNTLM